MVLWKGCVVEESLEDNRILNGIHVSKLIITDEAETSERWHIYQVLVSLEEIEKLHNVVKQGWYMHFWKGKKMIVLFKDKKFEIDFDNKESWKEAVNYGLSIGIPKEQLDFEKEF